MNDDAWRRVALREFATVQTDKASPNLSEMSTLSAHVVPGVFWRRLDYRAPPDSTGEASEERTLI